jgi:hypothetical protein
MRRTPRTSSSNGANFFRELALSFCRAQELHYVTTKTARIEHRVDATAFIAALCHGSSEALSETAVFTWSWTSPRMKNEACM